MNEIGTTQADPAIVPEVIPPLVRTTMGSYEVPELALLAEITKHFPEEDGVPLETAWHRAAMNLLIEVLSFLWRARDDFYVGGNMFIYYNVRRRRNLDFVGPDFFYVSGVERHRPREYWIVWEEGGKYPDFLLELLSESTAEIDRTIKKTLYEQTFRTPEYFCYEPTTQRLQGWRLQGKKYQEIETDHRGWLWSDVLQLWLGCWAGEFQGRQATWLRFYDAAGNLIPIGAEAEGQRAEAERQQAEAERQRAERVEAELAQIKARLVELEQARSKDGNP